MKTASKITLALAAIFCLAVFTPRTAEANHYYGGNRVVVSYNHYGQPVYRHHNVRHHHVRHHRPVVVHRPVVYHRPVYHRPVYHHPVRVVPVYPAYHYPRHRSGIHFNIRF